MQTDSIGERSLRAADMDLAAYRWSRSAAEEPIAAFRTAIAAAGFDAPVEIIPDGKLHRFSTSGKGHDEAGWYVLYLDGTPSGAFGCWRAGLSQTWTAKSDDIMSPSEREASRRRLEAIQHQREQARAEDRRRAAERAREVWEAAHAAPEDHPYLVRKDVDPHGIRVHEGLLVVPVRSIDGQLRSLQTIAADGSKRFMRGGEVAGGMYPLGDINNADTIIVCEGFATGATIANMVDASVVVAFNAGNLEPVAKAIRQAHLSARILICGDDDIDTEGNPGASKAKAAAKAVDGLVLLPDFGKDRQPGDTDFNDLAARLGVDAVRRAIQRALEGVEANPPRPLPPALPDVSQLDPELVPRTLRRWCQGVADGLQVPLEFVAVPAIVGAAGCLGRRVGVALKRHDLWVEIPILWGALIGRPSTHKSPSLRPLQRVLAKIEMAARAEWEKRRTERIVEGEILEAAREAAKKKAAKLVASGDHKGARAALEGKFDEDVDQDPEPRLVVNDATVEKLGEILNANPMGLIQFRDELAGWLASMDREGREADRGFWLECWNGHGPYTVDRIGRGTIRIEAPAVSILGGIQPGKLAEYVAGAVTGGMKDDGLLQRFQLAVWPDVPSRWRYIDRPIDTTAEAAARRVYERLFNFDPEDAGAEQHPAVDVPFLRLDDDAQALFVEWHTELMVRLRSGKEPAFMESHLAKYPGLAGRLALVLHLIEHPSGPVGVEAMAMALDWIEFLEPHARRMYAPAIDSGITAAHLLVRRRGELPPRFTARDVYRKSWSGLSRKPVEKALRTLVEYGHLAEFDVDTGGRPSTEYSWRTEP